MPKRTGVYLIKNLLDGKRYVGSTAAGPTERRMASHIKGLKQGRHDNRYLQHAWDKYGADSFSFMTVVECPPEECLYWEQIYMDFFHLADRSYGYNICPTAGSNLGHKYSEESRARMREVGLRLFQSEEYRQRHRQIHSSPEVRTKRSVAGKADWIINRDKRVAMMCEIQSRPEVKAKISAAHKGRQKSLEECANIKAAKSYTSPETRQRMSESARARGERCRLQRKEIILKTLKEKRDAKADKNSATTVDTGQ